MNLDQITAVGIEALNNSLKVHDGLGESGLQKDKINAFGDQALRADWECEEAVIQTLRKYGVPIRVYSEEHGIVDILPEPNLLGVLDGIDGTAEYKKARGTGRYGTMFGIFSNIDPQYKDYLFSGVMEHSAKALFHASKGKGTFVRKDGKERKLDGSRSDFSVPQKIYVDYGSYEVHGAKGPKLSIPVETLESSACHYTDFLEGKAEYVVESMRKGNLEIAVAFGLVSEAYNFDRNVSHISFMATLDGNSLSDQKYLTFAQKKGKPVTVITGQNAEKIRHMCSVVKEALLDGNIYDGIEKFLKDQKTFSENLEPLVVSARETAFVSHYRNADYFNQLLKEELLRKVPEDAKAVYFTSTKIASMEKASRSPQWDDFEPSCPPNTEGHNVTGYGECIAIVPKNSDR